MAQTQRSIFFCLLFFFKRKVRGKLAAEIFCVDAEAEVVGVEIAVGEKFGDRRAEPKTVDVVKSASERLVYDYLSAADISTRLYSII